jgi:hypothetical protein
MTVSLDSDAADATWVFLVLRRETGTAYNHQCMGLVTVQREITGAGIPCLGTEESLALQRFFADRSLPDTLRPGDLSPVQTAELKRLVGAVRLMGLVGDYVRSSEAILELDEDELAQLAEAWIPVRLGEERGVLMFPNSD